MKKYVKPAILGKNRIQLSEHICCGLGSKGTCGINHSRIS